MPVGKLATRRDIIEVMMRGRRGLCVGVEMGEEDEKKEEKVKGAEEVEVDVKPGNDSHALVAVVVLRSKGGCGARFCDREGRKEEEGYGDVEEVAIFNLSTPRSIAARANSLLLLFVVFLLAPRESVTVGPGTPQFTDRG